MVKCHIPTDPDQNGPLPAMDRNSTLLVSVPASVTPPQHLLRAKFVHRQKLEKKAAVRLFDTFDITF